MSAEVQALPSSHAKVLLVKTQPVAGSQLSVVHGLASSQAFVVSVNTHPVAGLQLSVVQRLSSLQTMLTPTHAPPLQTSPDVQALPSSQASVLLVKTHPVTGSQLSVVQGLLSLQMMTAPDWQAPAPHVSPEVHAFPSLHVVPSAAVGFEQVPDPGLQTPSTWHGSPAVHTTGFAPRHPPAWQESDCVHALPSSQVVPFVAAGLVQNPLCGSQIPATWH